MSTARMVDAPLPAHHTKHLPTLQYHIGRSTFHLCQRDDGISNGTALWLGAQILSAYLSFDLKRPRAHPQQSRPRAVELGSGIGLTALVLCSLGYDVLATDTAHVCDSVLRRNVAANLQHLPSTAGSIQVRELDWNTESERWRWNDSMRITPNPDGNSSESPHGRGIEEEGVLVGSPFDLIISSDTLYDVSLVEPFFRTVRALAALGSPRCGAPCSTPPKPPVLLLALERRDPRLIDRALASAPVSLTQVPTKKVRRALEKAGIHWDGEDWEGVEIWKGSLESCIYSSSVVCPSDRSLYPVAVHLSKSAG